MPETSSIGAAPSRPLLAGILAVALLPLISTPLLPSIDLYNHIARYFVLAHVDSDATLARNYQAHWSLLPNIGLDVIGAQLLRFVPATYAAHMIVAAIFAVQYSGILAFNRALTGRTSLLVALLAVPLLYSFIFNWGFANFLLGLGLVFWSAAWWLRQRHRLLVAVPVASTLAIIIFLTHGLAFALYGVLLGALEVGLWLERRPRRVTTLFGALLPLVVQAVIPVVLFVMSLTSHSATGLSNADESIARLSAAGELPARLWELLCHRLTSIVRVEEGPVLWLDIATLVLQLGILAALIRRGHAVIPRRAWPALVIAALLVAVSPPAMFGIGYVADRMPLLFAMILVGSLGIPNPRLAGVRIAVVAVGLIVAVRLVAITIGWQSYAADYREFRKIAALVPRGSLVNDLIVGGTGRNIHAPRCAMYRPLMVALDGQMGLLFANEAQQPLRMIGPLRRAVDGFPTYRRGEPLPAFYDRAIRAAGPVGFEYLLVCNANLFTLPIPPSIKVIARSERFSLLRLER